MQVTTAPNNADAGLQEKVEALRSAPTYSEPATSVESIETHFAWVFLVGDYAYKLKKPVIFPGMDLRPLSARRASCEEETRLNRLLAPTVYLGTVPLVRRADGAIRVGGDGIVLDWLVWMRRLPAALMLDRAIAERSSSRTALTMLGSQLGRFYRTQPTAKFTPQQYRSRIAEQMRADTQAALAPELGLDPHRIQTARDAMERAYALVLRELEQRALEDRIVEAHGDLRPEHICLSEPPCVIDSLEFSRDLRTLDPAEELAYLWIECEYAGDVQAASTVLDAYRQETGDSVSDRLLDFYRSRRAFRRAMIVAWHLCDPAVMSLAPWRSRAEVYLATAERYARRAILFGSFGAAI